MQPGMPVIVRGLSTFVAVVDESDSHFSYENLEKLLQSVGQRWMSVCEWAQMRAQQLNGLSELIAQYTSDYRKILEWLNNWEESFRRPRYNLLSLISRKTFLSPFIFVSTIHRSQFN
ncbi:hypothetical protein WUBG_09831 [Wuchereria bancrofti]|uniref:Uncharacterized protein n=1 Tax=Wuchereria bancrofti TaxID=6293 RepID=J9AXC8_WUCBA|nr:hypothetical protein WUBG_09831 [Wuchereria bancrofti]